jgi:Fe-S cluster assembly iron-binding protein IscA
MKLMFINVACQCHLAMMLANNSKNSIRLTVNDGRAHSLTLAAANVSPFLSDVIALRQSEEKTPLRLAVADTTDHALALCLDYCRRHAQVRQNDTCTATRNKLRKLGSVSELVQLMKLADFLRLENLVDMACQEVCQRAIVNVPVERTRAFFRITDAGFSCPSELEQLEQMLAWTARVRTSSICKF